MVKWGDTLVHLKREVGMVIPSLLGYFHTIDELSLKESRRSGRDSNGNDCTTTCRLSRKMANHKLKAVAKMGATRKRPDLILFCCWFVEGLYREVKLGKWWNDVPRSNWCCGDVVEKQWIGVRRVEDCKIWDERWMSSDWSSDWCIDRFIREDSCLIYVAQSSVGLTRSIPLYETISGDESR